MQSSNRLSFRFEIDFTHRQQQLMQSSIHLNSVNFFIIIII